MRWQSLVSLVLLGFSLSACMPLHVQNDSATRQAALGVALLARGYPIRAKFWLSMALHEAPHDPMLWNAWAYWQEREGDLSAADRSYHVALSLHGAKVATYNNYASFLCRQHQFAQALQNFSLAQSKSLLSERATIKRNAQLCLEHATASEVHKKRN